MQIGAGVGAALTLLILFGLRDLSPQQGGGNLSNFLIGVLVGIGAILGMAIVSLVNFLRQRNRRGADPRIGAKIGAKQLAQRIMEAMMTELPSALRAADSQRWEAELLQRIKERSGEDPLIGARIGSKELALRMMEAMTTERGVHIESLLGALGSLAGYSCQASVRAQVRSQGLHETALFTLAECADGKVYFFGDALNKPLAEDQYSIWSLAAAGAQSAGCKDIPDPGDVFAHVASTVGSPEFGLPRLPPEHALHDTPLHYVEAFWPKLFPMISNFCPVPQHWPILLGLATKDILCRGSDALDPCLALKIVMECAIPMSKIDLGAGLTS